MAASAGRAAVVFIEIPLCIFLILMLVDGMKILQSRMWLKLSTGMMVMFGKLLLMTAEELVRAWGGRGWLGEG